MYIYIYIYIFIYLFGSLPGDTMSLPSGPSASMLFFGQSQKFRSPAVGSAGFDVTRNDSSSIIFNCHFRDLNWRYLPYIYIYTHIMYIYYVYILCIYIMYIYKAYVRGYPTKIWTYMVQYFHSRNRLIGGTYHMI